jgi:hypothetical protein
MTFKEFLKGKELREVIYPVAKGVSPPPVNPSDPKTWSQDDKWRIINGTFNPPEQKIVERQKIERAKQREELKQFGVIFTPITPFKLNGGVNLTDNPIWKKLG